MFTEQIDNITFNDALYYPITEEQIKKVLEVIGVKYEQIEGDAKVRVENWVDIMKQPLPITQEPTVEEVQATIDQLRNELVEKQSQIDELTVKKEEVRVYWAKEVKPVDGKVKSIETVNGKRGLV